MSTEELKAALKARTELKDYAERGNYIAAPRVNPFLSFGTSGDVLTVRFNVKGEDNYERLLAASADLNRLLDEQGIALRFGPPLKKAAKRSSIMVEVTSVEAGMEIWQVMRDYRGGA